MTLEDWLKQDRSLADQLKVMEGLCGALNDGHQAGSLHRGLEPGTIEVAGDGACDLTSAFSASGANSRYRAPEVVEGAAPSHQSDIYAAGVIFYEMLSGRSPAPDRPTALADLRPDIQRDLTDAVMGCLEKGPDWRPKDLSYLLQVVRTLRGQGAGKGVKTPARATEAPRAATAKAARRGGKAGSTSNVPLFVAAALLLAGAGVGAWFWLKAAPAGATKVAVRPTPAPTTTQAPAIEPSATPAAPTGKAAPETASTPVPEATPTPRATAAPTPPPTTLAERPTPFPATPAPVATPTPEAVPAPEQLVAAAVPAVLTAVSPLQVKRGATAIFDVRGSGLRADQTAMVLKIKEAPSGISVVRQKFVNDGLVQVIVKLDATTAPGAYGLAMADANGSSSNALSFTVAK